MNLIGDMLSYLPVVIFILILIVIIFGKSNPY